MTRSFLIAMILGTLLRAALILLWGPPFPPGSGDTYVYHSVSEGLSRSAAAWMRQGSEFGFRPPSYFAYLAGIYRLFPQPDYRVGQAATAMLGLLTSLAVYLLLRAREDQASADCGAWLRCVLLSFVIADTIVMTEPLFALLQTASILVLFGSSPTPRRILLLGLLVGGCVLTREPAILYPALFGVWIFLLTPQLRVKVRYVALFVAAVSLALLPWLARNHVVWGHAMPLSYTAGSNLHIGNNPKATGAFMDLSKQTPKDIQWGGPAFDRWHRREAIAHIIERPWRFVALGFRKVALYLFPRFLRDDIVMIYRAPANSITNLVSLISGVLNALLVLAGIVGLAVHRRDTLWSFSIVLCMYGVATTFVSLGHPRFRDAADHLLLFYAAYLLMHWRTYLARALAGDATVRSRLGFAAVALVYIVSNWVWIALAKTIAATGL